MINDLFSHSSYLVRKKIIKFIGGAFHIFDPNGNVVFYSKLKAFKIKEDIRLYTGEDMQTEVLRISARHIFDFSTVYDVIDSSTDQIIGSLKRKGLKSMFKDEWVFMNTSDEVIGHIKEDSTFLALVRRLLTEIIPQSYEATIGDTPVCSFKQNFNPFVTKIKLDFSRDNNEMLDRRLGIAAAVLLCAIEGKQ